MKETIYTIPITDAFSAKCSCPICLFEKEQEAHLIEYTLGASMMEPDERQRSNAVGYCRAHYQMLLENPNKLSLALVLESHMEVLRERLVHIRNEIKPAKSLFGRGDAKQTAAAAANAVQNECDACLICQKLDAVMEKFIDNLFYLYRTDAAFETLFWEADGFCLPHTALLLEGAQRNLKTEAASCFSQTLLERQEAYLAQTQADVQWFTKKFDYRYQNEDWKNAKDAVPRAVELLSGK